MSQSIKLEFFSPEKHLREVTTLWQSALGASWPITTPLLQTVLANPLTGQTGQHFVALENTDRTARIIGFIAAQVNPNGDKPPSGHIMGIVVAPEYQRQGIGRSLLDAALDYFRKVGVNRVQIGGKYPRIWPGVPDNLPGALSFFQALDWQFEEIVHYDLTRSLLDYEIPDSLRQRMQTERITLETATEDDAGAIMDMQTHSFAAWADTYRFVLDCGDYEDILVARDPVKGVIGTLIMYGPPSSPHRVDSLWKPLLGDMTGGLGEVGVISAERGRGVGVALVAWGSEVLKRRGVVNAYISWTTLVDFYGRLGYRPWQFYRISRRTLP